jgi:vancomycin resistance protein YoaR
MLELLLKKKILSCSILLIVILIIIATIWMLFELSISTFYKGIFIEGINVSGLKKSEAVYLVDKKLRSMYERHEIIFKYNEKTWETDFDDISLKFLMTQTIDDAFKEGREGNFFRRMGSIIALKFKKLNIITETAFDNNKLKNILEDIKKQIDTEEQNAKVSYNNGIVKVENEVIGKTLDLDKNIELVENQIGKRNFEDIYLNIYEKIPTIIYNDIKDIDGVIESFSTKFNLQDKNRVENIKIACNRINNTVLRPNEIFSMNKALGPRTPENGYLEAPVIVKNELVKGSGGGVCQVTTTLYGAVLKSKLDVLERTHHSMLLGYVEPGQDATIADDYIDLKFQNNFSYPIVIYSKVVDNTLLVDILGKKVNDGNKVKLKSVILEEYLPEGEDIVIDDSIPDGEKEVVSEARRGLLVAVYRETYDKEGNLIDREKISEDEYKPVNAQIKVNKNYNINGVS